MSLLDKLKRLKDEAYGGFSGIFPLSGLDTEFEEGWDWACDIFIEEIAKIIFEEELIEYQEKKNEL